MLAGNQETVSVPPGQVLTVTPSGGGVCSVIPVTNDGVPGTPVSVSSTASVFGPYTSTRVFRLTVTASTIVYALSLPDPLLYALINADPSLGNGLKMITGAGVPTDGTTGANVAEKGSLYLDKTAGKGYVNGGTLASPVWKLITSAA